VKLKPKRVAISNKLIIIFSVYFLSFMKSHPNQTCSFITKLCFTSMLQQFSKTTHREHIRSAANV